MHGWAMARAYFDDIIPALSERYQVVAIDFRGHGASGHCSFGHRVARYATDVHELLGTLPESGPTSIVAWSMGASVALAMADLFPEPAMASMVLIDQPPACINTRWWQHGVPGLTRVGIDELENQVRTNFSDFIGQFVDQMFHNPVCAEQVERLKRVSGALDPVSAAAILVDHVNQDWCDVVRRTSTPILSVSAADHIVPDNASVMASLSPQVEVRIFEECGHCPFIEHPDEFVTMVAGFVDRHLMTEVAGSKNGHHPLANDAGIVMCFIVEDLEAAIDHWSTVFRAGPWYIFDPFLISKARYHGQEFDGEFRTAFSALGSTIISLLSPTDNKPSVFRDVVDQRGWGGLSHFGFVTAAYDLEIERLTAQGMESEFDGWASGVDGKRFAYFPAAPGCGPILEFIEFDPAVVRLFETFRAESRVWRGERPRRMSHELKLSPLLSTGTS